MTTENLAAFQSELSEMVRRESEATRRAFHAQWDLPVPQRVDKGRCIDGLKFAAVEENRFLRFFCVSGNSSDFREGDLVRLSRGQPTLPLLTGNLFRVDDEDVWFDPTENWRSFQHEIESGAWTLDPSYIDLDSLYQQAIA